LDLSEKLLHMLSALNGIEKEVNELLFAWVTDREHGSEQHIVPNV